MSGGRRAGAGKLAAGGLLVLAALLAACSSLPPQPRPETGAQFASEERLLTGEGGRMVRQLTSHPADDAHLYFTSDSFSPDSQRLLFTSKRSGRWQLYLMRLDDGSFVQLTNQARGLSGTASAWASTASIVFYPAGREVWKLDLSSGQETLLYTVPAGYVMGSSLTTDAAGSRVAFAIREDIPITTRTSVIYSDMEEIFTKKPWCAVISVQADGSGHREVYREKVWISHTLICPDKPDLILFCNEGKWGQVPQRMWLVHHDGSGLRPLRPEERPEIAIGHEFWMQGGKLVGYHGKNAYANMIGIANPLDGSWREYLGINDSHVQATADGALFVGDGSERTPNLTLYTLADEAGGSPEPARAGTVRPQILFRHGGSFAKQEWHPHPVFSPDGRWVLINSSRAGNGDMYLVAVHQQGSL